MKRLVLAGIALAVGRSAWLGRRRPSLLAGDIPEPVELAPPESTVRVWITDGSLPPAQTVIHGQVRVETQLRFVVENFVYRTLSVLIRESGL